MKIRYGVVGAAIALVGVVSTQDAQAGALYSTARPQALFAGGALFPGDSRHGSLVIPGAKTPVHPFARVSHLVQTCARVSCRQGTSRLADVLILEVAGCPGQHWSGSLTELTSGVELPGGMIAPGGSRTYALTLSLPSSTGNAYQDMSVSANLTWYGRDDTGATVTAVLGETFTRPGSTTNPRSTTIPGNTNSVASPARSGLPFTGLDVARLLTLAGLLAGVGGILVVGARRRWTRSD